MPSHFPDGDGNISCKKVMHVPRTHRGRNRHGTRHPAPTETTQIHVLGNLHTPHTLHTCS